MQISIQKLINDKATREEIADAMLLNYEDHKNILSDEDMVFAEDIFLTRTIDLNFVVTDICEDYEIEDQWERRTKILKISENYFAWHYTFIFDYDFEFEGCEKVIPHKKIVLDVEFLPVGDTPTKQETTVSYAKVYMGL